MIENVICILKNLIIFAIHFRECKASVCIKSCHDFFQSCFVELIDIVVFFYEVKCLCEVLDCLRKLVLLELVVSIFF